MKKVIFKMDTVDTDTQKRYSAGSDAVEVSEAFAERIGKSKAYGTAFEFEGESDTVVDTRDQSELREQIKAEFIEQFKGELKELEAEHEADIKLKDDEISQLKTDKESILNERSHFETQLSEANTAIEGLNAKILELTNKSSDPDAEKQAVKDEYELLLGNKPGNKSIDTMKAEIDAFKAESK